MNARELAEIVKSFLDRNDYTYQFDEEEGIFLLPMALNCKLRTCDILVSFRDGIINIAGSIDIGAGKDKLPLAAEFLTRANWGITFGKFELDYRDGEMRYQVPIDCSENLPSDEMLEGLIFLPCSRWEDYGDALLSVLFDFDTPEEAIRKVEEKTDAECDEEDTEEAQE